MPYSLKETAAYDLVKKQAELLRKMLNALISEQSSVHDPAKPGEGIITLLFSGSILRDALVDFSSRNQVEPETALSELVDTLGDVLPGIASGSDNWIADAVNLNKLATQLLDLHSSYQAASKARSAKSEAAPAAK